MFTNDKNLKGLTVRATDGELGTVQDCYFDDETWAIRYLVVETGGWLGGRPVLLSPYSIASVDWQTQRIDVSLTKKQVENSPHIDTHKPVSRQHEAEYLGYYGYPYYWGGPYMWGEAYYPTGVKVSPSDIRTDVYGKESADSHLRSINAVTGYHIESKDGEIGHLDHFIIEEEAWAIRYLEVATQNWWPGKKVLLSPTWVEKVSWERAKVHVALTRESIQNCPEYTDAMAITRDYENKLYVHYGWPPYWLNEARRTAALAHSGA